LSYADHWLNSQFSDAELRAWLPLVAKWHLKFSLAVGALKPWGPTADRAFATDRRQWDRFIADGARIDSLAMDEPLSFTQVSTGQTIEFAADQTARFITLVRQNYPTIAIGDVEPYPGISERDLLSFIDEVQGHLRQWNVRGMDFFRLDVNWMLFRLGYPRARDGWPGVLNLEVQCHRRGIPFSLIYWAANFPSEQRNGTATEATWEDAILQQGAAFAAVGGLPDEMDIDSWLATPSRAVPETEPYTFTRSLLDFTSQFAPGR
jgi:hypothetical protein